MIKVNVGIALSNGSDNWSTGPEVTIDPSDYKSNRELIAAIEKANEESLTLTRGWNIDGDETMAFVDISVQGEMPHKNKLEYQLNDFADTITSLPVGA